MRPKRLYLLIYLIKESETIEELKKNVYSSRQKPT